MGYRTDNGWYAHQPPPGEAVIEPMTFAEWQTWLADQPKPAIPDWRGLLNDLVGGLRRIVMGQAYGMLIQDRLVSLASGAAEFQGASDSLIADWNDSPPTLTEEQQQGLQAIADAHNIPLLINTNNTLSTR